MSFLATTGEWEVHISCGSLLLEGSLTIPQAATGLVIFAHGSGSSRLSPRNREVAGTLHAQGLATLLFDLLTHEEAAAEATTGVLRFNIPFLTRRLLDAIHWAQRQDDLKELPIGLFGASTGAAAALCAAAEEPAVAAVVSRGGRTDLASTAVARVACPTLLIVGEQDTPVLRWNQNTLAQLDAIKQLAIIPGATHLFHEHGALEQVASLAAHWFHLHLAPPP